MATPIQIRRTVDFATPNTTQLAANGEMAYSNVSHKLFMNFGGTIFPIGGRHVPGTLTANQAMVVNATSFMDVIKANSATINFLVANGALGNEQILGANSTGGLYWAAAGGTGTVTQVNTGAGLTGGPITGTGTVAVVANSGLVSNATGVHVLPASGLSANSTGVWVVAGNTQVVSNSTGVWITQGNIDHNSLANFDSNKHIDHTSVSLTAGNGLSGGGDISASRSFAVVANSGMVSNSTGIFVLANSGIASNATGVHVIAGSGIVANSTGVWVNPNTGIIANSTGVFVNPTQTLTNLTLTGNLTVSGTLTTLDTTNLSVGDNMFVMADQQATTGSFLDAVDIGFFVKTGNTSNNFYSGMARVAASSTNATPVFKLFSTITVPNNTVIDTAATLGLLQAYLNTGALVANATVVNITANSTVSSAIVANSLTLTTALAGVYGGTGKLTMTQHAILVGNATNGYAELALGTDGYVLQSSGGALTYGILDGGSF